MKITRGTPVAKLRELLTADEAAAWLGVGRDSIYVWAASGQLRCVRLGRLLRIPRSALEAMVNGDAK